MKRFLRKSIAFTMVFFMAVGLFLGNMSEVSAHEIYYENGVGIHF